MILSRRKADGKRCLQHSTRANKHPARSRFRATTNHMENAWPENDSRPLPPDSTKKYVAECLLAQRKANPCAIQNESTKWQPSFWDRPWEKLSWTAECNNVLRLLPREVTEVVALAKPQRNSSLLDAKQLRALPPRVSIRGSFASYEPRARVNRRHDCLGQLPTVCAR
jgi:hypothetical protein